MPIVKVSSNTLDQPKLVVANDFKSFIEKAEKKLGFKIDKIVRQSDASEIDDEEVFDELLKLGTELWFICLKETDKYQIKSKTKLIDSKLKSIPNDEIKPDKITSSLVKSVLKEDPIFKPDSKLKNSIEKPVGSVAKSSLNDGSPSKPNSKEKSIVNSGLKDDSVVPKVEAFVGEIKETNEDKPIGKDSTENNEGDKEAKEGDLNEEIDLSISDKELENVELFTKDELKEIENGNIEAALTLEHKLIKVFKETTKKMLLDSKVATALKMDEITNNKEIKTIIIESPSGELNENDLNTIRNSLFKASAEKVIRTSRVINSMRVNGLPINSAVVEESKETSAANARISNLFAEIMKAEKVDVCFMVDCTGSMKPYIDEVKQVLNKIVDKLKIKFKSFEVRVAFVGYRDHSEQKHRIVLQPFSNDIEQFKSFVTDVKAGGGADTCEDVFGGLEQVCNQDWLNPSRILLHISDAPCHGKQYHEESIKDDYPDGDPRGLQLSDLLNCLKNQQVSYYFAEINPTTAKMIQEFNKELVRNNSKKIKLFKLPSVSDLTELIAKSIIQTINETKSLIPAKTQETKNILLDTEPVDFSPDKLKPVNAILYKASYSGDLNELKTKPIEFKESNIELMIADKPFDKGSLRYAYAAIVNIGTNDEPNYVKQVVKQSIFKGDDYNTLDYYKSLIENQVVSSYLAQKFFELNKPEKSLRFIDVNIIYVPERNEYYSIEEFIEGDFVKWISNNGIINEDIYSCTLDSFSHWTHDTTDGYLIVTDLQGTLVSNKEYILTDPAITCPDEPDRFANTNLGAEGLKDFFSSHQCNHICRKLMLKKHELQILPDREENDKMTKLN